MLAIIEDTRQKADKHKAKHNFWADIGVTYMRSALAFGDYIKAPSIAVDTKQDITEIGMNMCGNGKEKHRFAAECNKAKDVGCKLVFLIEDKRFKDISDLYGKQIHLHNGMTIPGDQLATAMHTMSGRYGCQFMFCDPKDSGKRIIEILEADNGK